MTARALVSLPMYDLPELTAETDAWWDALAGSLKAAGVSSVPDRLDRQLDASSLWRSPDLLLSQICGYPFVLGLNQHVQIVATPVYDAEACEGPHYSSAIIVRQDDPATDLAELRGRTAAYNAEHSQSGYNTLRYAVAPLAEAGRFFGNLVETGGHPASIAAVQDGTADVAAVDGVTFALLQDYRPEAVANLRVLQWSARAPGLPLVTALSRDADELAALRQGLQAVMDDSALAAIRQRLKIKDMVWSSAADYQVIAEMADAARAAGYPRLA